MAIQHIWSIECLTIVLLIFGIDAKQNINISISIFNILISFLTLSLHFSGVSLILKFWTIFLCFELLSWPKIKSLIIKLNKFWQLDVTMPYSSENKFKIRSELRILSGSSKIRISKNSLRYDPDLKKSAPLTSITPKQTLILYQTKSSFSHSIQKTF